MKIGISETTRQSVVAELAKILAAEFVLYTKTRSAHWNVEGIDFYEKHKFFEAQFEQLDAIIDSIAERIRTLGHAVPATIAEIQALSGLESEKFSAHDSLSIITNLLSDHETIIRSTRAQISIFAELDDLGTSDFITGLTQEHEKMAWFLRAHVK